MTEANTVFLVGAGPGDPDLLTMKAHRLLQEAEVVVYDRLVSAEILALIPTGATLISVGKQPRNHPIPQPEINQLLVRLAKAGRNVVRLKGGDPYVFGRGSEEAMTLVENGVPFEVVPGITSASACSAAVGMPLTHRGLATGVRYLTGHCQEDSELDFDWQGLTDPSTTLVIYMGMANVAQITAKLIENGADPALPAAAINNGSTPEQRHIVSTLKDLAGDAKAAAFEGPVLFVVGQVVALHAILGLAPDVEQNNEQPNTAVGG
ncbi:MAG: uroporphyrinogen-III C-methyltransferase [Alphaproteobacteria bacterium]|jgi:uroporphyrin-III C-methyltransferase|nr:uroporphyrinogen-III C-methyltransferase [Alphaproteobacteria bacterium]MDP6830699.1 uroporphyrinogen-III C-methyltransferase [Alphaproteobacteria bacterium]MDP6876344.1 uroporphyrinogen-III C-methyltransferase [Alphaproteobacteria bacterium]